MAQSRGLRILNDRNRTQILKSGGLTYGSPLSVDSKLPLHLMEERANEANRRAKKAGRRICQREGRNFAINRVFSDDFLAAEGFRSVQGTSCSGPAGWDALALTRWL